MFEDPGLLLLLIPALPLAASALIALLGPGLLRRHSHWPCVLAAGLSCLLALDLCRAVLAGQTGAWSFGPWFESGGLDISLRLRADGLSALLALTVTFVGTLIVIFSIGYMSEDPGYPRFFAEMALFLAAMTGLVLADNYLLLYGCWEGVGLCSYLLIGFWFERPAAAAASRKAFLVTRLGDVGLFLGLMLLWARCGSLDYEAVFGQAATLEPGTRTLICLLLLCGAVGKSAQFPLHVWLPDAMEGPTPVSALIHAATMVTAGVYLLARSLPLFAPAPQVQLVVALVGGLTALLGALQALVQTDLKRLLAYSTISQLGYMFLALGSGLSDVALSGLAASAAIFHLFTHAFFKALLFLAAGSIMHALGGVIDLRRFRGLRQRLPGTHLTFLCGAAALAGVPLVTSGFWSKDDILQTTWAAAASPQAALPYSLLFILALATAGLTAFYTFRAYFLAFWGTEELPAEAAGHAHESPLVMLLPLVVLALGALALGGLLGPTGYFEEFLEHHWLAATPGASRPREVPSRDGLVPVLSALAALAGLAGAWVCYVQQPALPQQLAARWPRLTALLRHRFYLDEIYTILVVRPLEGLAFCCRAVDQHVVDGLVDLVAQVPAWLGQALRPIQNGLVQFYALLMLLGLTGFLLAVLLR